MSKRKILKKFIVLVSLVILIIIPLYSIHAQTSTTSDPYTLLQPINGFKIFDATQSSSLATYLNLMIHIFIGICAVLAVVMIVIGGIEYMGSDLISSKEDGKKKIKEAVLGLILALGAYALLFTINPDLLNTDLNIQGVSIQAPPLDLIHFPGESSAPFVPINQGALTSLAISCPNSGGVAALSPIAQSFIGHATYSQAKRNTSTGDTAYVDCSSYVAQVYKCAGLPIPGNNSSEIFSSSESAKSISADGAYVNGIALKTGDLLGWTKGGNESNGHVMMYIGGGKVIDSEGPAEKLNQSVSIRSLASLQNRIRYIKRI